MSNHDLLANLGYFLLWSSAIAFICAIAGHFSDKYVVEKAVEDHETEKRISENAWLFRKELVLSAATKAKA